MIPRGMIVADLIEHLRRYPDDYIVVPTDEGFLFYKPEGAQ